MAITSKPIRVKPENCILRGLMARLPLIALTI